MKIFIFWLPRIMAIIVALFLMVFSFDVFDMPAPLWKKIGGFLIHSLPTFLIIFFVLLTWKKPLIGATVFATLFLLFTLMFKTYSRLDTFLLISLPLIIISFLFFLDSYYERKEKEILNK